jgi:predicted glycoside hydrolase/deacetylase ChbG (UPF0249 family)
MLGVMERRIVFCADELGLSSETNEGIRRVAHAGLVREASLCVTGDAAEEGAALARELRASLGVGLELCFTAGRALTGYIRGLTDEHGRFLPASQVFASCLFGRPDPDEVAREVEAQLVRLRDYGLDISHVGGRHGVHLFPRVREAVLDAAPRHGIRWTRAPGTRDYTDYAVDLLTGRMLIEWMVKGFKALATSKGLRSLPYLAVWRKERGEYRDRFEHLASRLPRGRFEWSVHPRLGSDELAALADPIFVQQIRDLGIEPSRFEELMSELPHLG